MALTDNLVSYWKFDGDATDSVSGFDGTAGSATTNSASYGKINQGYDFSGASGTDSRIDVGTQLRGQIGNHNFTISCWVKFDVNGTNEMIMGHSEHAEDNLCNFYMYRPSSNVARFHLVKSVAGADIGVDVETSNTYDWTTWHHIVMVANGGTTIAASQVSIYIDGINVSTTTNTDNDSLSGLDPFYKNFVFGSYYATTINFNGQMDEPAIWSRALSDYEVLQLYNSGSGNQYPFTDVETKTDRLVSYWKFDGDATDSVGSNDLTNSGATSTTGIINNGYNFIASQSDYMVTSSPINMGAGAYSISIWIKPTTDKSGIGGDERVFIEGDDFNPSTTLYFNTGTGGVITWYEYFDTVTSGDRRLSSSTAFTNTSKFYHVVLTKDGSGNKKIYVDGSLEVSGVYDQFQTVSENFYLGRYGSSSSQYADVVLDEPAIWNRALTSTEVSQLYNAGAGLQYPFSVASGWTGKINEVTNPAKVNPLVVANISAVNTI